MVTIIELRAQGEELPKVRVDGEAAGLVARVREPAVEHDVELPGLAGLDVDGPAAAGLKPSLHTEGFGFVASGGAVVDDDGHGERIILPYSRCFFSPPSIACQLFPQRCFAWASALLSWARE